MDGLLADGTIVRTHVLRPTWHLVAAADLRWLQALTAPRVHAVNAYYYRALELDGDLLHRTPRLIAEALAGGVQLTRPELQRVLADAGLPLGGSRLAYVMMHAELNAVVCSGARRGRQFTYALVDDRVPAAAARERESALAELAWRYLRSHGPATTRDLAWWSGLTAADARAAVERARPQVQAAALNGETYWLVERGPAVAPAPALHLLPSYDEHLVAYRDHSASFDPLLYRDAKVGTSALSGHIIVIDGLVVGGWRRTLTSTTVSVETTRLRSFTGAEERALVDAAGRYGQFLGRTVRLR